MKISKQISKLERVASKLGWEVTGDVDCLELIWGTNNIIFHNNENKQDILNTIDEELEELEDVKDEEFKQQLITLYKVAQRIIRTTYEEKEDKGKFYTRIIKIKY